MTIQERFLMTAAAKPDKLAVIDDAGPTPFGTLSVHSALLAFKMMECTERPNVGILLPGCAGFVASFFGILLSGKTPVPLNFLLKQGELETLVADAGIDTLLTSRVFAGIVPESIVNRIELEDPKISTEQFTAVPDFPDREESDTAAILYTSGTTGAPRGVMLTHGNLLSNLDAAAKAMTFTEDDVMIGALPPFHSFALTATILMPLLTGATTVIQTRFNPGALLEGIERYKATCLCAVPTMVRTLIRAKRRAKTDKGLGFDRLTTGKPLAASASTLRLAVAGGEPLPRAVADDFEEAFGLPLLEGYGMTETSPVISLNRPDAHRPGAVGQPIEGVQVRIGTPPTGKGLKPLVPDMEEGEIFVRGPNVMAGYLNRPEETGAVLSDDGWLKTGDIGCVDGDGFLTIRGRSKDLIISGGENIHPAEIEQALAAHPKVAEAAVLGVPDPRRGEVPKAYVVLREGSPCEEAELIAFLRDRLAPFKLPKSVEFLAELPRTATGKVAKNRLAEG